MGKRKFQVRLNPLPRSTHLSETALTYAARSMPTTTRDGWYVREYNDKAA